MNQNDDRPRDEALEKMLRRHAPQLPETKLRAQVLAAVSTELAAERSARWRLRLHIPGWAVAASIAWGVTLNVWAMRGERTRDVRLFGSQPPPRRVAEIAEAVRSITDSPTATLIEQRLQVLFQEHERNAPDGIVWPLLSARVNSPG